MKHLFYVCFLLSVCTSYAQDISNNTNLYVGESVILNTSGAITNQTFIQNKGLVNIQGDWLNENVYQGNGKINLNGQDQSINNNEQEIHSLSIEGGGRKTINNKIIINNMLTLSDGIVVVENNNSLLMTAAGKVKGGSTLSYVQGTFTVTGTGYKVFPLGIDGFYLPVAYIDLKGITPVVALSLLKNAPTLKTASTISPFFTYYWQQNTVEGTFSGSPIAVSYPYTNANQPGTVTVIQGASLGEFFDPLDGTLQSDTSYSSNAELNKNIFLFATELVPTLPSDNKFYFSTNLSHVAQHEENRLIKIFGDQIEEDGFSFVVYNRWGNLVYESQSLPHMRVGWNGQNKVGQPLAPGTYPYYLKASATTGDIIQQKGFITILD